VLDPSLTEAGAGERHVTAPDPLAELLGESPAFTGMKDRARHMLARAGAGGRLPPVLIQGETGTGKGLLARALHQAGPRAAGPFVAVNCGAVPETLGESEFFGFARGAHSEARHPKIGLFQAADHGTIFLDEVGLLSEGHQARLLKVVEDRQVVPVGSTRGVPVDLWVISATNADLRADVEQHRFRRDLYERLAVMTFTLPPLRERPDDILPLAGLFLARACAEYGLRPKRLAPDAERRLVEHSWPGNVRELSNVIERAALLVESTSIDAASLELAPVVGATAARSGAAVVDRRERIREALARQRGNITRAAADVGVSRKTLRDWMRQEGLYPLQPAEAGPAEDGGARARPGAAPLDDKDEARVVRAPAAGDDEASSPPGLPPAIVAGDKDIHWERRWITLLRVSLAPRNEDGLGDATRALEIVADKIQTFGGSVIELGKAGLDAAFGLDPLEYAAQRAAYAALAIERAGARGRDQPIAIFVPTMALHTDSYLVGRLGQVARIDQEAKQSASALLAALIGTAPPEGTVVGRTTLPFLRRRFDFDGPVAAGVAGEAHRLLGRARRPAFDAQTGAFVGREAESALLEDRFDLAVNGHGQIVGIVGDPGVGKSRLVWEFVHRGTRDRGLVLETASVAVGRPTPFLAIIELLRTCFGVEAGAPDATIRDTVAGHLADLDPSLTGWLPAFLSLLDVPTGDSAWEALDPARRRQRTFDAIRRLMLRESLRQPLVLVFEDAHWADSETKALLDAVADSLPLARVLMLVTFRPEHEHGWASRSFYTQIRVDPLRGDGLQRFLRDLLGEHPSVESLRTRLMEWTGGNPFFLEETIRTLAETKALEGERGAYRLMEPLVAIAVPNTIHEVLAARMGRLAPTAHETLQAAAAIGRRVPHAVLAAVSAADAGTLEESLELLRAREFLSETGPGEEREYTFWHALTQEVAYTSLPEERRQALHGRIFDAIERVYADRLDDKLTELVHHALEGRRWEEAVRSLHRAGTRALAQSANTEAAAFFERALVALSHLPERRERQELGIDLRFGLRNALTPLGQVHRTLEHLREAERLAGLLGDDGRRGRALSFAANCLCLVADYEGAIEASEQARQHAEAVGDFPLGVAAGMYLGRAHAGLGEYRRAALVLHEVAASLTGERVHDYLGLPVLPAVFARSQLVLALAELGEFDAAERFITEAIEIAEGARHPDTLLWAHTSAGVARLVRGQLAPATSALERAQEILRAADIPVYVPLISSPLGLAYAMGGRVAEGLALAEQAVQTTERRRQVALLPWTLLRLGEVRMIAGQLPEAQDAATRALGLFREHKERGGEAYALRLLGEVERHRDGTREAERLIAEAHRLGEDLGMRPLAARCQLWLGIQGGPSAEGPDQAAHLAAATRAFNDLGMEHWAAVAGRAGTGQR
jgi:DNA-binding NtrC family response regulator/tetratricopeptide (TPR) repeat protein